MKSSQFIELFIDKYSALLGVKRPKTEDVTDEFDLRPGVIQAHPHAVLRRVAKRIEDLYPEARLR